MFSVLGNFCVFRFRKVSRFGQLEIGCKDSNFPPNAKKKKSKKKLTDITFMFLRVLFMNDLVFYQLLCNFAE